MGTIYWDCCIKKIHMNILGLKNRQVRWGIFTGTAALRRFVTKSLLNFALLGAGNVYIKGKSIKWVLPNLLAKQFAY